MVAVICSVTGIAILYFFAQSEKLQLTSIGDIDGVSDETNIRIRGKVKKVTETGKATLLEVEQPARVRVMIGKEKQPDIEKGSNVEVVGKTSSYKGKKTVNAERVLVID